MHCASRNRFDGIRDDIQVGRTCRTDGEPVREAVLRASVQPQSRGCPCASADPKWMLLESVFACVSGRVHSVTLRYASYDAAGPEGWSPASNASAINPGRHATGGDPASTTTRSKPSAVEPDQRRSGGPGWLFARPDLFSPRRCLPATGVRSDSLGQLCRLLRVGFLSHCLRDCRRLDGKIGGHGTTRCGCGHRRPVPFDVTNSTKGCRGWSSAGANSTTRGTTSRRRAAPPAPGGVTG